MRSLVPVLAAAISSPIMNLRCFLALAALAGSGCAPALSTMQPAHVAPRGHVQLELGTDVSIPTGTIVKTIEAGKSLVAAAANERELTEAEKKTLFDAGGNLALNPPSPVEHIGIGVTIVDNLEVNLRYSISALRLGARYQILSRSKHGVDFSAGFGVSRYMIEFPVNNVLNIIWLEDFERWQFDFPISFGISGNWYRLWGGPRVMLTTYGTELILQPPPIGGVVGKIELASLSGTGAYLGGQGGVAVGYKYVFLAFELTLVEHLGGASLEAFGKRAPDLNLNSFIVYPSVALLGEF